MDLKAYLAQGKKAAYYVDDIEFDAKNESGVVFILESPHIQEVAEGKPLMGASGEDVSQYLLNQNKPFGKLVESLNHKIAIINVSNVPLQVIDKNKTDVEKIADFQKFRTKKPNTTDSFYKRFEKKIKKYIKKENVFVICGDFAHNYFFEVVYNNKSQMKSVYEGEIKVLRVPHPSGHSWQKIEKYKDDLTILKEIFSNFSEK